MFLRVDEHNWDSYIGRDVFFLFFFSGEVFKFVRAQIYVFRRSIFDFFLKSTRVFW